MLQIAILPVFLLLAYIYNCDKYEKEPASMLIKAFLCGFFGVSFFAVLGEVIGSAVMLPLLGEANDEAFSTVCLAPLCEEGSKFLFLYYLIWNNKEFNEHFDGIVYAVYVSLGFACLENIFYVLENGFGTVIMLCIYSVPGHFLFAVSMGYFFALAKFTPEKETRYLTISLLSAMFLHFCYNGSIVLGSNCGVSEEIGGLLALLFVTIVSIFMWVLGVRKIRHLSELSKNDPPAQMALNEKSQDDQVA